MALACWKCGASLREVPRPISRLARCPECFSDLYCCRMCRKYAPRYTSRCSDERADPPEKKQTANFCDWFSPDPDAFSGSEKSAEDKAREELASLFGGEVRNDEAPADGEPGSASDRALAEIKKLFGESKNGE